MMTVEQHAQQAADARYLRGTIVYSPGKQAEGPPFPMAVRKAVGVEPVIVVLGDGTRYQLWTDGSFRTTVRRRRPAGLNGRQRRLNRKAVQRAFNVVRAGTNRATAVVNQ